MLAEDPRYGAWLHRITAGDPLTMPGVEHSTLGEFVSVSADGTQVPITVAEPEPGAIRTRPTLMTVYGGFGISLEPGFDLMLATWLDAGGRVAWMHARGGSERGEPWAAAGRGAGEHNTVADFRAAARHLADYGYVRAGQLTAMGVKQPRPGRGVRDDQRTGAVLRRRRRGTRYARTGDTRRSCSPPAPTTTGCHRGTPGNCRWRCSRPTRPTKVLLDHDLTSGHRGRDGLPGHLLAVHVLILLSRATGLHAPALPTSVDAL